MPADDRIKYYCRYYDGKWFDRTFAIYFPRSVPKLVKNQLPLKRWRVVAVWGAARHIFGPEAVSCAGRYRFGRRLCSGFSPMPGKIIPRGAILDCAKGSWDNGPAERRHQCRDP